jgi:hypothetical protein
MRVWRDALDDAICVYAHPIARTEPPVLERAVGGLLVFPVTERHRARADVQFSGFVQGCQSTVFANHAGFHAGYQYSDGPGHMLRASLE